jgi:hypothetical protein
MTFAPRALATVTGAILLLPAGAAAYLGGVETLQVHIVRSAGTCPAAIAVRTVSQGYEGGVKLDISAKTLTAAYVSELVSATPKRLEFSAELRPAYASCQGAGHSSDGKHTFTLKAGKLTYVLTPGLGPNATPPALSDVEVVGGFPRVLMAFSD